MTKTKKFRALEKSRALSFYIFILEVYFMSKIDFLLPKVDGKLDVKTPSRWHISDRMLAEEFAHFADKNSHISHDRGALIGLIYRQLTAIHDLNIPIIEECVVISDSSNTPCWVRELVRHLSYNTREQGLPGVIEMLTKKKERMIVSATDTAIPSDYDVFVRLLVAMESDEFVKRLSGFMYRT